MCVCVCPCECALDCVCMHVCVFVYANAINGFCGSYLCVCVRMHVCVSLYGRMNDHVNAFLHVCVDMCMNARECERCGVISSTRFLVD